MNKTYMVALSVAVVAISLAGIYPSVALGANPAFVQGAATIPSGGGTITIAFPASVTAGDLIVGAGTWGSGTGYPTCTDNQGDVFATSSLAVRYDTGNNQSIGICYAANVHGGPTTVTVTFPAAGYTGFAMHEYSSIVGVSPLDAAASGGGAGSAAANGDTTASLTTTAANDLVIGFIMDDSGGMATFTAGTGFSLRQQPLAANSGSLATEDKVQATAGATTVTFTASKAESYIALAAAFKAASIGPDLIPPSIPANLTAIPVSTSAINLAWSASTDNVGVAGYNVFRNGIPVGTTTNASYNDTGLAASTTYSYAVDAFDAVGNVSAQSAPASVVVTPTTSVSVSASTPGFVQGTNYAVLQSNSGIPDLFQCHCIKMKLPNPAIAGNAFVVAETWGSATVTSSITDDKGDTFVSDATVNDGGNGQSIQLWHALNVTAGAQVVTITFNGGTLPTHTGGFVWEFKNIATSAAVDGTACTGNTTGTSVACSSGITTTQANDLIVQFATNDNTGNTTNWTAGTSPWALEDADRMSALDNHAGQWQVQTASGTITPSLTIAPSSNFITAAVALKSTASGGDLPAGIKVIKSMGNTDDTATGRASPFTIQAPCPATTNLLVGAWIGATGDLNSVSGTLSGAWTSVQPGVVSGASGEFHMYYKQNVTSTGPTDKLTLTTAAATSLGDQFLVLCVNGAATSSVLGAFASSTGSQAATGTFNTVLITPQVVNSLIVAGHGQASNNSDPPSFAPGGYYDPPDENNTWGHYYATSTSAIQFTATGNVGAPGNWVAEAAEFKAP